MTLIFIASSDPESGPRGSRLLGPLLHWLWPDLAPERFEAIVLAVRKLIHFVTFGFLAALLWRAFAANDPNPPRPDPFWKALGVTFLYAASDEIHQSFVPTRVGTITDVLIDTLGAGTALILIQAARRFHQRR